MRQPNPYAAGSLFGHYKMMQNTNKMTVTLADGYSPKSTLLSESYPMTGFRWFQKIFASLYFGRK